MRIIASRSLWSIGFIPQFSPDFVKNCRQHPEYKSAASGLRFPFTPRALSGWYVPSPDLGSPCALNGRNAEYSGRLASRDLDLSPEPDREEKGLAVGGKHV